MSPILSSFSTRFTKLLVLEYGFSLTDIGAVYPCTAVQAGMLSQFLRSSGSLYFNHMLYELSPTINISLLKQAWTEVMEENEILRAGFVSIDDDEHSFATVIHSQRSAELPWSVINTNNDSFQSVVEEQKRKLTLHSLAKLEFLPWHLTLINTQTLTHLLLSAHHALYDAQSLRMVLDDVMDHYYGVETKFHSHLSGTLATIVSSSLDTAKLDAGRTFWQKHLEGCTISTLPSLTDTRVRSSSSHVTELLCTLKLSQIETAVQKLGYSLHAVAQAAWARVLSAYLGEQQVMFGLGMYTASTKYYDVDITC